VQRIDSYNHDSGKVSYEPVSYICEELVEATRRAYQESGENLGMKLEETLRAD